MASFTPTGIPTSFVPKQPVKSADRYSGSGSNTFFVVSLIILGAALIGAGGTFAYERYLTGVRDAKAIEVQQAEERISATSVEEFIRTRDRFSAAKMLLENHVATSQFFTLLEELTLENVRFNSLSFVLVEDGSAEIQMDGVARTFNALAAQSSLFAEEKRVKRAIFSDITVNQDNDTVVFALEADISPDLLTVALSEASAPLIPAPSASTTTPATSTPATTSPPFSPPATSTPQGGIGTSTQSSP
ncbi:hypothetical protein L0Y34_01845 [Candidatus Parcubacteria bacterium]|nr:hypothetical protein [Candidatus Parcubacteria bacterium]